MKLRKEELRTNNKPYEDPKPIMLNVKFIYNRFKIDFSAGTFLSITQKQLCKTKCNFGFSFVVDFTFE